MCEKLDQIPKKVMDVTERDLGAEQRDPWGDAMLFSTDILPWWIWLSFALPLACASWLLFELHKGAKYLVYSSRSTWVWEWTLATILLAAAFLCAAVGFVGFVKWAWPC